MRCACVLQRLSEAGAGGLGTSSDWNASSGKVFSAGYSHPKAAALQQIVKPDPVSQPSSSGQQGGDACPPPCGRPLKKKWMQDHEQRLMQDQEQRLMQEQEQRLMHEQEQRLMHEQAQRLQEENNCSIKVEAKVEAKSQTRDSADGKVGPRGARSYLFHCIHAPAACRQLPSLTLPICTPCSGCGSTAVITAAKSQARERT